MLPTSQRRRWTSNAPASTACVRPRCCRPDALQRRRRQKPQPSRWLRCAARCPPAPCGPAAGHRQAHTTARTPCQCTACACRTCRGNQACSARCSSSKSSGRARRSVGLTGAWRPATRTLPDAPRSHSRAHHPDHRRCGPSSGCASSTRKGRVTDSSRPVPSACPGPQRRLRCLRTTTASKSSTCSPGSADNVSASVSALAHAVAGSVAGRTSGGVVRGAPPARPSTVVWKRDSPPRAARGRAGLAQTGGHCRRQPPPRRGHRELGIAGQTSSSRRADSAFAKWPRHAQFGPRGRMGLQRFVLALQMPPITSKARVGFVVWAQLASHVGSRFPRPG